MRTQTQAQAPVRRRSTPDFELASISHIYIEVTTRFEPQDACPIPTAVRLSATWRALDQVRSLGRVGTAQRVCWVATYEGRSIELEYDAAMDRWFLVVGQSQRGQEVGS